MPSPSLFSSRGLLRDGFVLRGGLARHAAVHLSLIHISYLPAKYGMDVIDSGVAVLSMHSPWEVTSKADIYEAFKGYQAFLKNA